jgi:hypothetical protein
MDVVCCCLPTTQQRLGTFVFYNELQSGATPRYPLRWKIFGWKNSVVGWPASAGCTMSRFHHLSMPKGLSIFLTPFLRPSSPDRRTGNILNYFKFIKSHRVRLLPPFCLLCCRYHATPWAPMHLISTVRWPRRHLLAASHALEDFWLEKQCCRVARQCGLYHVSLSPPIHAQRPFFSHSLTPYRATRCAFILGLMIIFMYSFLKFV